MTNARRATFGATVLWLLAHVALADNGMFLCGSGTFRNQLTCSPTACTGTLIPTCAAPEGFTSGAATLSFLQGVCDDLGPVPCASKFKGFFEGCGGTRRTNAGLNTARVPGMFRVCYDPSGAGQCSGSGMEILRASERWETYTIGSAPNTAQADLTVSVSKQFTFNGKKTKLSLNRGFALSSGENGACDTADCGFGGCLYKTK